MIPAYLSPIFNHLWQSTLVAAVAGLLALALRKNHAGVRYWVWFTASVKFFVPFSLLVSLGSHLGWSVAPDATKQQFFFVMEQINGPFAAATPHASVAPAVGSIAETLLPTILLAVWFLGCAAVLLRWYVSWHRIRTAVRAGSPLNIDGPVRALSTPVAIEPGVFGIFRPVLLLPEGIDGHLAPAHLNAIVAHEMCHVRRRDNLAAALHMLVEAAFWFHPLVWWIGARLVEERERACDEEVLKMGSEPRVYAESILKTCEFYVESPLACVSGVTGADLKQRIVRIMTHRTAYKLGLHQKLMLAAVGLTAVAGPIAYGLANAPPANGPQPQATAPLSFEVASVKSNKSGSYHSSWSDREDRFTATNMSLEQCIETAYAIRPYQIAGPAWLKSERYDIAAKADHPIDHDQLRQMLQTLLAERFKLATHLEQKVLPVYELVVGKSGPKIQAVQNDGHNSMNNRNGHLSAQHVSMMGLAEALSRETDRPVVDATGLKGTYNFKLAWTPDDQSSKPPSQAESAVTNDSDAPSIFTAVEEQLGLKLEARKAPAEMLVIDHVEKVPTEN